MEWGKAILAVGQLFGPVGVVAALAVAGLLYALRVVWARYQALLDKQPETLRIQVAALTQATNAFENNTRAKEANTAALVSLRESSERHTASCDRMADELRRLGDFITRNERSSHR